MYQEHAFLSTHINIQVINLTKHKIIMKELNPSPAYVWRLSIEVYYNNRVKQHSDAIQNTPKSDECSSDKIHYVMTVSLVLTR